MKKKGDCFMLTKNYVFTSDDWYKHLDWNDRTCECGRNMDCVSDRLIEETHKAVVKQSEEVASRMACVSSIKNAKFVFHRLYETIMELNKLRKSNEVVEDYMKHISQVVEDMNKQEPNEEDRFEFTVLKWLDVAEDISTSLDHACIQDPCDKEECENLARDLNILSNIENFFASFKEALRLQYVLLKCPIKYRKTLIKLCRKQCVEAFSFGSTISIDQLVYNKKVDDEDFKGVIAHELGICKLTIENFKAVEKSMEKDFEKAWSCVELMLKGKEKTNTKQ